MSASIASPVPDVMQKVKCAVCGHEDHSLLKHVLEAHGMQPQDYLRAHPGHKLLSPFGKKVYDEMVAKNQAKPVTGSPKAYDSKDTFGVGFGKENKPKPIAGYEGFTFEDGVPDVDPHYLFPETITRDVLMGFSATPRARVYAKGPTGSGKTSLFEQIAARTGRPFWRQQFHGEMELSELFGFWVVNDAGAMEFVYSGLVRALQMPSIICFDEYDSGNAPVTAAANALLEGKPLVLANKGGEKVHMHPDCVIVATGNTNGLGDDTGLYASTSVQSFATMNRFSMFVTVDYMSEAQEQDVLKRIYPQMPKEFTANIAKVAKLVRDAFVGGSVSCPLSTRQVICWAQWLMMSADPKRSFALAFLNQLGPQDKATVEGLFQRVFGK